MVNDSNNSCFQVHVHSFVVVHVLTIEQSTVALDSVISSVSLSHAFLQDQATQFNFLTYFAGEH